MVDPVIGQGALQRLSDVILTDNLGECVGTIAPVERKRRSTRRASARVVEQRLILTVLDLVWLLRPGVSEPQVVRPGVFHPSTLCLDGDSRLRCKLIQQ